MKTSSVSTVLTVVLLAGLGLAYYAWQRQALPPPQSATAPTVPAASEGVIEGQTRFPIERAVPVETGPAAAEGETLPELQQSDDLVGEVLAGLLDGSGLGGLLVPTAFIHRVVATVDNLPRERLPRRILPLKPAQGRFLVEEHGAQLEISPSNEARYTPYVLLAEQVDSARLVAAYGRLYPLFQRAYQDLGYPNGYFNDRLVDVIDHLLATPRVEEPVRVIQPGVLYQFADPELARLSAGQRIMIRMGQGNADRVKAKLGELRHLLAGVQAAP